MGSGLFTDEVKLAHQATHFEPTELLSQAINRLMDAQLIDQRVRS